MVVQLLRRKFTVEQFHKMAESGILNEDDRVELIRGEIIEMAAIGLKHAACRRRLNYFLSQKLGDKVIISIQNAVLRNEISETQPDVVLLKPREDFYASAHPQPKDVFLVIEVADITIKYDREVKIPLYAEESVIEVWLVDINDECIEVYQEPANGEYKKVQKFSRGESLIIQAFSDVNISVDEILGNI
ncbi:Uma2 family endonuclease [Calothrix sp. CCY 0018]|uniref:Uma2 family endonuclease n=1 Tax=Calothrix sp. CCY 0018 TaxID=3103864 RepID=UPI0039C6265E